MTIEDDLETVAGIGLAAVALGAIGVAAVATAPVYCMRESVRERDCARCDYTPCGLYGRRRACERPCDVAEDALAVGALGILAAAYLLDEVL